MISFIEVFAGCGGLSTGLQKAGLTPVLLVDNDADCCKTLQNNKTCKIIKTDVTQLSLVKFKDKVDLLVGGIPCQPFSQAGLRKGISDKRGTLFDDFCRLLSECEPEAFMVENVEGMLNHDKGETIKKIVSSLSLNGKYSVTYKLLNANDYNVAQKRKRVFIVGHSLNSEFRFPEKLNAKPVLRDALEDCPISLGNMYSKEKRKVLDLVPAGGCWVNLPLDVQKRYLGGAFTSGGGRRGMARRLSWDEPCLTLTTSPSQKQTERCHPDITRPLTVREYARIQTFPDDYKFSGSIASQYKQIGNAVPVNLAYHMGTALVKFLEYEKVRKNMENMKI